MKITLVDHNGKPLCKKEQDEFNKVLNLLGDLSVFVAIAEDPEWQKTKWDPITMYEKVMKIKDD